MSTKTKSPARKTAAPNSSTRVTKEIVKAAAKAAKAPVSREVAAARSQAAYKAHLSRQAKALKAAKSPAARKEATEQTALIGQRLREFQRDNAKLLKSA